MKILSQRSWILPLLKAGVAAGLLAGLGYYLDPMRIWERLQEMDSNALWAVLALGALGILVQWIKWYRLLVVFRPETTWGEGLNSLLLGFALGLFSPGRLGELGRGVLLGGKQATWVGLSAVDRLCSAAVSVLLAWLGLAVLYPAAALSALGVVVLIAGGLGLVWVGIRRRLGQREGWRRVAEVVGQIPRPVWLQICLWSVVFNLVFFVQFYLLLASWGPLPAEALWGVPLFFGFKVLLPFSIMDIGVREAVAVLVFTPLQLDSTVAFNAAFLQFMLNVLFPGVAGWVLLYGQVHRRLGDRRSLRGQSALSLETRRQI